jgi:hypothetical protein
MKKLLILVSILILQVSCKKQTNESNTPLIVSFQANSQIQVTSYEIYNVTTNKGYYQDATSQQQQIGGQNVWVLYGSFTAKSGDQVEVIIHVPIESLVNIIINKQTVSAHENDHEYAEADYTVYQTI